MSLKSLGIASLGLLKQGVKRTLEIASLGLLQTDGGEPEPEKQKANGDGFVIPGMTTYSKYNVQNNNLVLVLLETEVF